MQTTWNWIKENGGPLATIATVLVALTILFQFGVLNPILQRFDAIDQRFDAQDKRIDDLETMMNQRFDAQDKHFNQRFDAQDKYINQRFDDQGKYMGQRFDAVDQRLESLENDVSELRKIDDRVSRNEGQIDVIRQQLQTVDTPLPSD